MKIVARKNPNGILPKREQLMSERLRATTLREQFPDIEQLRIELIFHDPNARTGPPSPQRHTLYSAASAFFRFACPCADCDGDFDLTEVVNTLLTNPAGRKRTATFGGHLACRGVRFRDHTEHEIHCPMQLTFQLVSEPRLTA